MKAFVTDGKHNTTTKVTIHVEDVNDNAPEFEHSLYETTIFEEDKNVPRVLFHVQAIDRDRVNFCLLSVKVYYFILLYCTFCLISGQSITKNSLSFGRSRS